MMDPNASPIDPNNDAVTNLARSRFAQMESDTLGGVAAGTASFNRQSQDAATANAQSEAASKLKELESVKAELQNPNNYEKVRDPNTGGFVFFNPLGQKIPLSEYARVKNQEPKDILEGSINPNDDFFRQQYAMLERYIQLKVNQNSGDLSEDELNDISRMEAANPQLTQTKLDDLSKLFRKRFASYYEGQGTFADMDNPFLRASVGEQ